MVRRLVSFWEGPFSAAMLVLGADFAWKRQVLGVPLTPDFSAVGLAYFAQAAGAK